MNDLVEVTGKYKTIPTIQFIQKINGIVSMTGEKIHERQFMEAVEEAEKETDLKVQFYVGFADIEKSTYRFYFECLGAAMGYAKASGIPYAMGIVKNKYIGRTFIAPTQSEREKLVFVKLNALKSDIAGKRIVVIDDSIVRGTTSKRLISLLRKAGAKEVHMRISSPPVKFPCHFGIDTPSKNQLISSSMNVDELCQEIGADSLAFISIDGMFNALKDILPESYGYCKGCFTGEYPLSVPGEMNVKRF